MFGLGTPELVIILVIILFVFGAGKLPEIGSGLGKAIRNFRTGATGKDEKAITSDDKEKRSEIKNE